MEWLKKPVNGSAETKTKKALAQRRAPLLELVESRHHHTFAFRLPTFDLPFSGLHVQPEPCGFMKEAIADGRLFVTRDPRAAAERLPLRQRAAAR